MTGGRQVPSPLLPVLGFALCSVLCLLAMFVLLSGACGVCSMSASWHVALAGALAWLVAAWIAWIRPVGGTLLGGFAILGHVSLFLSDGSFVCGVCWIALIVEAGVWTCLCCALRAWKHVPRGWLGWAVVVLASLITVTLGGVVAPRVLYSSCPESWRHTVRLPDLQHQQRLLLFVDPGCGVCEELSRTVLPRYRQRVSWTELSRCSPLGKRLMRVHQIRAFPTLIIESNGTACRSASGIAQISSELEAFEPHR